jgi:hypothetical protein
LKSLKYIALVLFSFLWLLGCSKDISGWFFERGLVKDDYRYGDLYRMSNLSQFKELKEICPPNSNLKKTSTHLILAGDSFTEKGRIDSSFFASKDYTYVRVDEESSVSIDFAQSNILIIETVERHFRERFGEVWKGVNLEKNINQESDKKSLFDKLLVWELPYSTELHESILFGYDGMQKVREWKANINFNLFNRIDDNVRLNKSEEYLLYYLPSESGISSGFDKISDEGIDILVANVNATYLYYKSLGFENVILSIIPNKTSILGTDLGSYNELLSRVQNHKNLIMPVLNVYEPFKRIDVKSYAKGDSHWSCAGQAEWVALANTFL